MLLERIDVKKICELCGCFVNSVVSGELGCWAWRGPLRDPRAERRTAARSGGHVRAASPPHPRAAMGGNLLLSSPLLNSTQLNSFKGSGSHRWEERQGGEDTAGVRAVLGRRRGRRGRRMGGRGRGDVVGVVEDVGRVGWEV